MRLILILLCLGLFVPIYAEDNNNEIHVSFAKDSTSMTLLELNKPTSDIPKIVGGVFVENGEIPYQVGIVEKGRSASEGTYCGGVIIDENWILTSAHCLNGKTKDDIYIFSGEVNLNNLGTFTDVDYYIVHDKYNSNKMNSDFDIALIKLKSPLKLDKNQNKIKILKDSSLIKAGQIVTASGWGRTESGWYNTLKKVDIKLVDFQECIEVFGNSITSNMICAGFEEGGRDACNGDSGGPLTTFGEDNQSLLLGIVSWGPNDCGRLGTFGVYTDINKHLNWIINRTNLNF